MREEELRMAARAQVEPLDRRDAGPAKRPLGGRPQVEMPGHGQILVEERRDLLADLVAARADRRPDRRGRLASHGGDRGGGDALREAAPPGVHDREPAYAV